MFSMVWFVLTNGADETFLMTVGIETNVVEFLVVGFTILIWHFVGLGTCLGLAFHGFGRI
jgi:hypothetical protein